MSASSQTNWVRAHRQLQATRSPGVVGEDAKPPVPPPRNAALDVSRAEVIRLAIRELLRASP